jgi:hypothetical protein
VEYRIAGFSTVGAHFDKRSAPEPRMVDAVLVLRSAAV